MVAEESAEVKGERIPVEVKGDNASAIANARRSIGPVFRRGVIVTTSRLDLANEIPAVPAATFLAALRERPERTPISI